MSDAITTLHTVTGMAILKQMAEYRSRQNNSLITSGFFGAGNYKITGADIMMNGSQSAQIYGVNRQKPAEAFIRSSAKYHQYNYEGGLRSIGVDRAYVSAQAIDSAASFSSSPHDETKAQLDYIPFDLTTGTQGWSLEGGLAQLITSRIDAHFKAIEDMLFQYPLRAMRAIHNIKRDNDTQNPLGTTIDFATDTGRTIAVQTTDLSSTNTDSLQLQARSFNKERMAVIGDIINSTSRVPFHFLPLSAFNTIRTVFSSLMTGQLLYQGAQNMTAGDYGMDPGIKHFHAGGVVHVAMPDAWFDIEKVPASTGPDCYITFILPSSAICQFQSPASMAESLNWGEHQVFSNTEVLNRMLAAGALTPNTYNMLATNDRSDKFLDAYVREYNGGEAMKYSMLAMNSIRTYLRSVPPGIDPNALAITLQARTNVALIRTQPHFIQTWAIPVTKV